MKRRWWNEVDDDGCEASRLEALELWSGGGWSSTELFGWLRSAALVWSGLVVSSARQALGLRSLAVQSAIGWRHICPVCRLGTTSPGARVNPSTSHDACLPPSSRFEPHVGYAQVDCMASYCAFSDEHLQGSLCQHTNRCANYISKYSKLPIRKVASQFFHHTYKFGLAIPAA